MTTNPEGLLEKRIQSMAKDLQEWKTDTPQEKRDKSVVLMTLYYLRTGRVYKPKSTKGDKGN